MAVMGRQTAVIDTGGSTAYTLRPNGAVMSAFATTCPYCSCGCGFYLLTSNGQLRGVAPSETHPVSWGKLCARGWSAHEAALWGERLSQPLLRTDAKVQSVSWDEAFDQISKQFRKLIEAGKPVGVLGSARATNEENYLAGKLARAGLCTNNVDFCYHCLCVSLLEGLEDVCGGRIPATPLSDIASSQAILLLDGDCAETHPRVASAIINALNNGAYLITIGYRRTQMARLSSLHLFTTPGQEREVIRALLAAVLELQRQERNWAPVPAEEYEALWRNVEKVERTKEMRQAAERMIRAGRATFLLACNGGGGEQARMDAAAFATLAAVTGHLSKPGSGLLPLVARSNVRGACDMGVTPERLPGYEPLDDDRARQRLLGLWQRKLPGEPGNRVEKLLQSVNGLIVLADDPASVVPLERQAMTALQKIEFLVVLDAFVTPTAQQAHVVLPIASFAETDGTVTNMEARVQRLTAAANPPGRAKHGWQVLGELCARFGLGNSYASANDVLREIARAAPQYAGVENRLSGHEWSTAFLENGAMAAVPVPEAVVADATSKSSALLLVVEGSFDWGRDPLVRFSPTLSRAYQSERKLFPNGFVELSQHDAGTLKVSAGNRVRLRSERGQALVPIKVCKDLKPGVLCVPYAFRDKLAVVLGREIITAVNVEPP